jgi:hypothetical protein
LILPDEKFIDTYIFYDTLFSYINNSIQYD